MEPCGWRRPSALHDCHEGLGSENGDHPLQVVDQDVEADLGLHVLQPLGEQMGSGRLNFNRVEGVLHDLPA